MDRVSKAREKIIKKCKMCNGKGSERMIEKCEMCGGKGIELILKPRERLKASWILCKYCDGKGYRDFIDNIVRPTSNE